MKNRLIWWSNFKQKDILFFILKLIILFFLFDYFFQFLIAASTEGGVYLPILDKYNLAEAYRDFLLKAGGLILNLFGYEYYVTDKYLLIPGGGGISLGYSCYGFSVISVYIALILAYPKKTKIKSIFLISGTFLIVFLNILRISILAIVFTEVSRNHIPDIDHHLMFNIIVYVMIFGIFYWYVNRKD